MLLMMLQTTEYGLRVDPGQLERLLLQTAAGDQEAFADLYHAARSSVYALALSMLKHAHDAQDVTQDTFVRVWEKAETYRAQGSPMAWILTIARNLALTKLRQGSRSAELSEAEWDAIPVDAPALTPEDRHVLQTALSSLSAQERQVVLLHAVSGLKHREIAALLALPLPTVLSKYHRALKKLRVHMEGDDTCDQS